MTCGGKSARLAQAETRKGFNLADLDPFDRLADLRIASVEAIDLVVLAAVHDVRLEGERGDVGLHAEPDVAN